MALESPKLSIREKLAYGLGDSAANLIGTTQGTFLLYFYTDVYGITAHAAGAILLWSRLIDALNDPIMGALADRTTTRWGKYRPWILWTAVPLAAALVLCFTTPRLGDGGKLIWAIVTYNLLMIAYAANNIPYCALSGVMTSDGSERTSLASWRFLCAMAATMIVATWTIDIVGWLGGDDKAKGFQRTMAVWGCAAVICLIVTFAATRERVPANPLQRRNLRQDLIDLMHNGPWASLFLLSVANSVQVSLRAGTLLYYFEHVQQAPRLFGWIGNYGLFNGTGLAAVMVGVFLSVPISRRLGKRRAVQVCMLLSAVLMASFALLPRDAVVGLFALQIAMQLAIGPTIPLLWAMMADVADYGEWITGRRSTALAFASVVFGMKLGGGLGGWLGGQLLHGAGYTSAGEATPEVLRTITWLISVYPAVALAIGFVALAFYRIDQSMERQIEATLRQTKGAPSETSGPVK